ncbi:hypothetical protein ABVK25_009470 [Lepraria finkii]|uniref:DUF6594 domain-containing protein n=1 Tax=Lepraria finkii TaxID=1340010 RepID=A0ABR4B375_9LECA
MQARISTEITTCPRLTSPTKLSRKSSRSHHPGHPQQTVIQTQRRASIRNQMPKMEVMVREDRADGAYLDWTILSKTAKKPVHSHEKGYFISQVLSKSNELPAHVMDEFAPGYGKVAAIQDLDRDFLFYRKFSWLYNYVILQLQDEIACIQEELECFDEWEAGEFGDFRRMVSASTFEDSRRRELLNLAILNLKQYYKALLRKQKIYGLKRPTNRSQNNLYNLISNTHSLVESESAWVKHGPDLAALGYAVKYSWLNTFLIE